MVDDAITFAFNLRHGLALWAQLHVEGGWAGAMRPHSVIYA
tara:strand:- start:740 stop:862 length:123 start_codon:yes stop_codon:yes gene_type:complete